MCKHYKRYIYTVLNKDDTITKTVELSDFCNLNNIAYKDCLKLFTELYISMFKK